MEAAPDAVETPPYDMEVEDIGDSEVIILFHHHCEAVVVVVAPRGELMATAFLLLGPQLSSFFSFLLAQPHPFAPGKPSLRFS